jgi:hypothetical protein
VLDEDACYIMRASRVAGKSFSQHTALHRSPSYTTDQILPYRHSDPAPSAFLQHIGCTPTSESASVMAVPKLDASISTQPNRAGQGFVYTEDDHWSTTSVPHVFTSYGNIDLGGRMDRYEESKPRLVRVRHLCATRIDLKLTHPAWHHTSSDTSPNDTCIRRRRSTIRTAIERRKRGNFSKGNMFEGYWHRTSNRSIAEWRWFAQGDLPNCGTAISTLRH